MEKKYFIAYIPAPGEIKEGVKVKYSGGRLGFPDGVYTVLDDIKEKMGIVEGYGIRWNMGSRVREDGKTVNESAYLKIGYNISESDLEIVELFVCSNDVQIGDEVFPIGNWDGPLPPCDPLKIYAEGKKAPVGESYFTWHDELHKSLMKIVGRVSTDAIWVKPGMEFNYDDLRVAHYPGEDMDMEYLTLDHHIQIINKITRNKKYRREYLQNREICFRCPSSPNHFH